MTEWIRFSRDNQPGFGVIENEQVASYKGDMFDVHEPDGEVFSLCDVTLECPLPSSVLTLGIWNNFDAVREKQNFPQSHHPWYFIKPPTCLLGLGRAVHHPQSYTDPVIYEAELAIVIGARASHVPSRRLRNIFLVIPPSTMSPRLRSFEKREVTNNGVEPRDLILLARAGLRLGPHLYQ